MSEETTNEGAETPVAGEAAQYAPDQLQGNGNKTANGEINLDLVLDIPVNVSLRVGSTDISIRDLVKLVARLSLSTNASVCV